MLNRRMMWGTFRFIVGGGFHILLYPVNVKIFPSFQGYARKGRIIRGLALLRKKVKGKYSICDTRFRVVAKLLYLQYDFCVSSGVFRESQRGSFLFLSRHPQVTATKRHGLCPVLSRERII